MGNTDAILRHASDDSDAYVTFDARSVILDIPDDGRVAELLPGRAMRAPMATAGARLPRRRAS